MLHQETLKQVLYRIAHMINNSNLETEHNALCKAHSEVLKMYVNQEIYERKQDTKLEKIVIEKGVV